MRAIESHWSVDYINTPASGCNIDFRSQVRFGALSSVMSACARFSIHLTMRCCCCCCCCKVHCLRWVGKSEWMAGEWAEREVAENEWEQEPFACFSRNVQASAPNIQNFCSRWSRVYASVARFAISSHHFHYWKYIRSIFIAGNDATDEYSTFYVECCHQCSAHRTIVTILRLFTSSSLDGQLLHCKNESLHNSLSFRTTTSYRFLF